MRIGEKNVFIYFRRVVKPDQLDSKKAKEEEVSCSSGLAKYLISFKESASDEVVQYIVKQLEGQDLQCEITTDESGRYATVSAEFKVLAKQARNNEWVWSHVSSCNSCCYRQR